MSAALTVRDLSGGYVRGTDVLGGASFEVEAGQIVAVLGPNGGGKTTLFRALLGELPFRSGEVALDGRPAYVPAPSVPGIHGRLAAAAPGVPRLIQMSRGLTDAWLTSTTTSPSPGTGSGSSANSSVPPISRRTAARTAAT